MSINYITGEKFNFLFEEKYTPLNENSIGKVFVRCFPSQRNDHSYMPKEPVKASVEKKAMRLIGFKADIMQFKRLHTGLLQSKNVKLDSSEWNDGHWMPLENALQYT